MKNIHLLPTDKSSRLGYLTKKGKEVFNDLRLFEKPMPNILDSENQHIYITSDEKTVPGKGDWYLGHPLYTSIHRWHTDVSKIDGRNVWINKIILTTDQDLINDGVQAIDDEFLEWFIKNPSCESVEVEIETTSIQLPQQQLSENSYDLAFRWINKKVYKIIIPKEEPKQETLEEVAERYAEGKSSSSVFQEAHKKDFIEGAKWQQKRMYSEEEVRLAYFQGEKDSYVKGGQTKEMENEFIQSLKHKRNQSE